MYKVHIQSQMLAIEARKEAQEGLKLQQQTIAEIHKLQMFMVETRTRLNHLEEEIRDE